MVRRCTSILVITGFLLGQWAAIPHVHAHYTAEQQRRHDAQPHVHVHVHRHEGEATAHTHYPPRADECHPRANESTSPRSERQDTSRPKGCGPDLLAQRPSELPPRSPSEPVHCGIAVVFSGGPAGLGYRIGAADNSARWLEPDWSPLESHEFLAAQCDLAGLRTPPPADVLRSTVTYLILRNLRI